jgi:hypothetical protein
VWKGEEVEGEGGNMNNYFALFVTCWLVLPLVTEEQKTGFVEPY